MTSRSVVALGACFMLTALLAANAAPRRQPSPAPATTAGDKRDRTVAAPGTAFHGKAYWQATAQCGGIYFKVGTIYSEDAIKAKVVKPNPAAYADLSKRADVASRTATAFFEAAEHFLTTDRRVSREEAVLTYDAAATAAGDRVKSLETGVQAAKPCAEFYLTCRTTYPQMCNDMQILRAGGS